VSARSIPRVWLVWVTYDLIGKRRAAQQQQREQAQNSAQPDGAKAGDVGRNLAPQASENGNVCNCREANATTLRSKELPAFDVAGHSQAAFTPLECGPVEESASEFFSFGVQDVLDPFLFLPMEEERSPSEELLDAWADTEQEAGGREEEVIEYQTSSVTANTQTTAGTTLEFGRKSHSRKPPFPSPTSPTPPAKSCRSITKDANVKSPSMPELKPHSLPNAPSESDAHGRGQSPLHLGAAGGYDSIVGLLLDSGAQVDATDQAGRTPLHWAIVHGQTAVARLLLERGAGVGAVDESGFNALHTAVTVGDKDMVKLLLESGADIHAPVSNSLLSENKTI
jgi:hypothetical protein